MTDVLENQKCPACFEDKATFTDDEKDIPYFGKIYIFTVKCLNCGFSKADIESAEQRDPVRITFEVSSEEDLKVRVVRSSEGLVKIPQLKMSMEPGEGADGFVSNVEGLINKFEKILEQQRDSTDEDDVRKKAKNLLKKIWKVKLGELPLKIIIEDKSGNSAIVSEKASIEKLKGKK